MLNGGKGIKQMMNRVVHLLKNAGKAPFQAIPASFIYIRKQYAKFLLKTLGEIAGRAEARSLGNFIHTLLTFLKQGCCTTKADAADKCHGSSIGQSRQLFYKVLSAPYRDPVPVVPRHIRHLPDAVLSEHSTEDQLGVPD